MRKPRDFNEVLSERKLSEWLNLPVNEKTGHSRTLGNWIKKGLEYISIGDRRFFTEKAALDFMFDERHKF